MPVMSAGIRSGVNWIRLNRQSMTSAMVRTSIVLPRPGTPSRRTWLLASSPTRVCRTSSRWPTMTFPTSASMAWARSANASGASLAGGSGAATGCVAVGSVHGSSGGGARGRRDGCRLAV